MKSRSLIWLIVSIFFLFIAVVTIRDYIQNKTIHVCQSHPEWENSSNINHLLYDLESGVAPDFNSVKDVKRYVDGRFDCADFDLQSLIKIMFLYREKLSAEVKNDVTQMLLDFKYWMDEPGCDGMCYWSENHQILFATSEYLAGQLFPNRIFTNNGMTGLEHQAKAKERIIKWLQFRWQFGFSEWFSTVYYVEDLAALSNLIDFAEDDEIVIKSKIIMDLLLYDLSSQSYKGTFITTSGRIYEKHKKSGTQASTRAITEFLFNFDTDPRNKKGIDLNFIFNKNYKMPEVFYEIAHDTGTVILKNSMGINLNELKQNKLIGKKPHQIMMQWGMEAFTNPEVISNTIEYIDTHNMFSNQFLNGLSILNYSVLKQLNLLPIISKILKPQSNGLALQRANTYAYRTNTYSMYTAQSYHPGEYGMQESIFGVTLSNDLSIFHNHPAVMPNKKHVLGDSPSYWVGNGYLPHSAQCKNINLTIYDIPEKKGLMEKSQVNFTHLYFPAEKFDTVFYDDNYLFARYKQALIAFIGEEELVYNACLKEVVQKGKKTFWICELGTTDQESFSEFINRIKNNRLFFDGTNLLYRSNDLTLGLTYKGNFSQNGKVQNVEHKRFESPYIVASRNPQEMYFDCNGKTLYLNFDKKIREEHKTENIIRNRYK